MVTALVILCFCLLWTMGFLVGRRQAEKPEVVVQWEVREVPVYIERPVPHIVQDDRGRVWQVENRMIARPLGAPQITDGMGRPIIRTPVSDFVYYEEGDTGV
jgi:hypothetical protein